MKIPLSPEERAYWGGEDISYAMKTDPITGESEEVAAYVIRNGKVVNLTKQAIHHLEVMNALAQEKGQAQEGDNS